MIVGAGKMGEACVRHLAKKGAQSVLVVNRSPDKARALAADINGTPLPFEQLLEAMKRADIVVSSTGARRVILQREAVAGVMRARGGKPLFLVDIAVPRDIDPAVQEIEGVYLYNIDHLQSIVQDNVKQREQELSHCHAIIGARAAETGQRLTVPRPQRESGARPAVLPGVEPTLCFG